MSGTPNHEFDSGWQRVNNEETKIYNLIKEVELKMDDIRNEIKGIQEYLVDVDTIKNQVEELISESSEINPTINILVNEQEAIKLRLDEMEEKIRDIDGKFELYRSIMETLNVLVTNVFEEINKEEKGGFFSKMFR